MIAPFAKYLIKEAISSIVAGAVIGVGIEVTSHLMKRYGTKVAEKAQEAHKTVVMNFTKARARRAAEKAGCVIDEDGVIVG